jgi:hypothetical protein
MPARQRSQNSDRLVVVRDLEVLPGCHATEIKAEVLTKLADTDLLAFHRARASL